MTVVKSSDPHSSGGTFSETSIARSRPDRGGIRRAEPRRPCRLAARLDTRRASRPRGADQLDAAADRPCGRCTARSQSAESRARDRGGSKPHRPCRAAPCRGDKSRAFPQGDGTFHARHIPSVLYFRPCPSARPGDRGDVAASVGTRGRAKGPSRPRRRLDDLSGRRRKQARCQLWLHQGPRLPSAACDPGRYRRGAPSARSGGAGGQIRVGVGSGFWSNHTNKTLARLGVSYTMAVRTGNRAIAKAITEIKEDAWVGIDYTEDGIAEVAETTYKARRLIVRRTRLVGAQEKLWPDWRH